MKRRHYLVEDKKTGKEYGIYAISEEDAWYIIAMKRLHIDINSEECFSVFDDGKKEKRFEINEIE